MDDNELWDRKAEARRDNEPDAPLVCEWCDDVIDQADVSVEAFEVMGGPCCASCFEAHANG